MTELEIEDRQTQKWTLLRHSHSRQDASLAIFVHGFGGDHLSTWGRLPEMLRMNAPTEPVLDAWDFLFLGYSTRGVATYLDIASKIAAQWESAATGRHPYPHGYVRLALFGHSLGTLGIRQLLCASTIQPTGMIEALHSITLFGTPLNGSPWAMFGPANVLGGQIADALKPGNRQLRMLHSWTHSIHPYLHWRDVRVVLGTGDWIVGNKYAELISFAGDARPVLVNSDHLGMVKPAKWGGSLIRDEILRALQ